MKAFTPKLARQIGQIGLRTEIIQLAYRQLIHENIDKPVKGEATFTQGALSGRIHHLGLGKDFLSLLVEGTINQEEYFAEHWTVFTHPGFYTNLNSHAIIRFTEK